MATGLRVACDLPAHLAMRVALTARRQGVDTVVLIKRYLSEGLEADEQLGAPGETMTPRLCACGQPRHACIVHRPWQ